MWNFQILHVPQTQRPRMRSAVLCRNDPISIRAAWWRHSRPISSSGAALIRAVNLLEFVRPAEVKPPRVAGCCLSLTGPRLCQDWNYISSAAWLIKTCMIKTIYINKVTTREKRIRADGEYECVLCFRVADPLWMGFHRRSGPELVASGGQGVGATSGKWIFDKNLVTHERSCRIPACIWLLSGLPLLRESMVLSARPVNKSGFIKYTLVTLR